MSGLRRGMFHHGDMISEHCVSQVKWVDKQAEGSAAALMAMIDLVHGALCPDSPYA